MRLKISTSEESQLHNVIKKIKSSVGPTKEQLSIQAPSNMKVLEEGNDMGKNLELQEPDRSKLEELSETKISTSKVREMNDKASQTTSELCTSLDGESESEAGEKCSKKKLERSSYLDEVYNLLANEDWTKSELLNIGKLLADIGLHLPYADRRTGQRFLEKDQEEFKTYMTIPQNREVLKVYVRLSIIFQKHVREEERLLKRATAIQDGLKKVTSKMKSSGDKDESPDRLLGLKNVTAKLDNEFTNCLKSIMKSKKERFHYMKLFNQTKLLLSEAFQDWRSKLEEEKRNETVHIEQEKRHLEEWARSLRYPLGSGRDNGDPDHHVSGSKSTLDSKRKNIKSSDDSQALIENVKRLDKWAWNMRHRPTIIPEPDVAVLKSFSSINVRGEDDIIYFKRTSSAT